MKDLKKYLFICFYLIIFIALVFISIIRLINYQVFQHDKRSDEILAKRLENIEIRAKRGSIYSNDGHKLVLDIDKYNIILAPANIKEENIDLISELLAKHVGKSFEEISSKIREIKSKNKNYYNLKVKLDFLQLEKIKKEVKATKIKEKWFFTEKNYDRAKIEGNEFESILGFVNKENKAVYGVEHYYDKELRGEDGVLKEYLSASKVYDNISLPHLLNSYLEKEVVDGHNIHLTIDSVMQYNLNKALQEAFEQYNAKSAMGILMEVDTGKIIAMDSFPKIEQKADLKNRPIIDLFEPGSIFKPITISAAIEEKLINKNTVIHSEGFIRVKNRVIHDHDSSTKGDLPLYKIVAHSGNVAMVKIAQMMETEKYYEYLENFGFGKKLGIDTSFEFSANLFPLKNFSEVRKSNVSFGQGIAMTQLQMISSLNATINGGNLLKPIIVDRITNNKNEIVRENKTEILHKVLSEETSAQMRDMLELVATHGTGRRINIEGYRIGAKTGTAQKAGPRGYEKGKYFSSFYAFLPAHKPKYAILITVNEPQGGYYGAAVALPPAKKVLEKLIKYKAILPDLEIEKTDEVLVENIEKIIEKSNIKKIKEDISNNIMPNFIGQTMKNIVYMDLKSKFPKIKFVGNGVVVGQNIEKGEEINSDIEIVLEFK